jgi:hypothetical protein
MRGSRVYPEIYKCNSRESTFLDFCVDGINLFDENKFIVSLGLGRDSNPDSLALKPSECTTTPSTSPVFQNKINDFIFGLREVRKKFYWKNIQKFEN